MIISPYLFAFENYYTPENLRISKHAEGHKPNRKGEEARARKARKTADRSRKINRKRR